MWIGFTQAMSKTIHIKKHKILQADLMNSVQVLIILYFTPLSIFSMQPSGLKMRAGVHSSPTGLKQQAHPAVPGERQIFY